MKILNSRVHGMVDYAFVAALWLAPSVGNLDPVASLYSAILGCIHLALTLITKFELGVLKLVPFKIHGLVELVVPFALIGVAFYLGSVESELSRNYFFGVAVAVFATWLITDYSTPVSKINLTD